MVTRHGKTKTKALQVPEVVAGCHAITANTPYGSCAEPLSAFGGLLALVKVLDLLGFKEVFDRHYVDPGRTPLLGHRAMVTGLLMLLHIGFHRVAHFAYIRRDPMVTGALHVPLLPVVSTFWRYLKSMGLVQALSLLRLSAALRERAWKQVGWAPTSVSIDIDTTTATVYGEAEGSRKGYNPKHRGKKGLRPIFAFIAESREFLCGTQRRGTTVDGRETAWLIGRIRKQLPSYVENVLLRADGEMMNWKSVKAAENQHFQYILGNKRCAPVFKKSGWYRQGEHEYNECLYQPIGWEEPRRFVVMRITKANADKKQLTLPSCQGYVHRIFVTNLQAKPHKVVAKYDKRAGAENLIGEAQREGILAIPSNGFHANLAFFQLVMLAYNLWRWTKMLYGKHSNPKYIPGEVRPDTQMTMPDHTIRLARLKLLFLAAKVQSHAGQTLVRYSIHDTRAAGLMGFFEFLDRKRKTLARQAASLAVTVQKNLCTVAARIRPRYPQSMLMMT